MSGLYSGPHTNAWLMAIPCSLLKNSSLVNLPLLEVPCFDHRNCTNNVLSVPKYFSSSLCFYLSVITEYEYRNSIIIKLTDILLPT